MVGDARVVVPRRLVLSLVAMACAVHALHAVLGQRLGLPAAVFDTWIYDGVVVVAGLATLARGVLVAEERRVWLALGGGLLAWAAGEIYWSLAFTDDSDVPTPSVADVLYLLFYPGAYVAIVALARSRAEVVGRRLWLDGLIGALALAAVGAALVFEPVRRATDGAPAVIATELAYPLADLLLGAMVVGLLAVNGWRVDRRWALLVAGFTVNGIADGIYLFQGAEGTYVGGGLLDSAWLLSVALLAFAAWQPPGRTSETPAEGMRTFVVPALAAAVAVAVLVYGNDHRVGVLATWLAVAALAAVVVRMSRSVRANEQLLAASRLEALTDPLTGLGNRRALMRDLGEALADGAQSARQVLVIFDLNGFKQYNDRFGHPAGDVLLQGVGTALAEQVAGVGRAYRSGGDEFVALLRDDGSPPAEVAAEAATALVQRGDGYAIGACFGEALLPAEAHTTSEAMRVADLRLYASKASGRGASRPQDDDALLSAGA